MARTNPIPCFLLLVGGLLSDPRGVAFAQALPPTDAAPASTSLGEIESTPLGTPAAPISTPGAGDDAAQSMSAWARTAAALLATVGLAFAARAIVVRASRRTGGLAAALGPGGRAPSGLLEILGRFPVARGQSFVLLRLDRRVLLLGQSSTGFTTLTEVSDPDEVASLLVKARDDEGASNATRFNELLRQMEREPLPAADQDRPGTLRERLAAFREVRA